MRNELPYSGLAYDIGTYEPDDLVLETAEGAVASFDNGADDLPLKSLVVNIEPKQSGSGDPSPTNVRPISGWSGVNVNQTPYPQTEKHTITGKNLYNAPNDAYEILVPCHIPANTSFVVSCASGDLGVRYYDGNKNLIDYWSSLNQVTSDGRRYRVLSSNRVTEYVEFYGPTGRKNFMVEIGSTPSPYEPYGQGYSIDFKDSQGNPITVYGGEIDVVSGSGKSTMVIVDLGTLEWYYNATYDCFYSNAIVTSKKPLVGICSKYAYAGPYSRLTDMTFGYIYNDSVAVKDSTYNNDPVAFKTAMNGVQLCYELATPTPIYCTPTEIKSLKGSNNVWSDAGDVNVGYLPQVEKNTFPYSGTKYYVGVFEPIEEEEATTDTPLNITPIDEPINLTPIDEPIDITPIEPIDEPIVITETEEIDNG